MFKWLRRPEGGRPIREMRRDRIVDARGEGESRYRAEMQRLDDDREWRRREDERRYLDEDRRRREEERYRGR